MLVRLSDDADREHWVNPEEVAFIEDIDPGPPYHSSRVLRSKILLRCGTAINTSLKPQQVIDRFAEAQEARR